MSSTVPKKQMTVVQAAFTGIVSWLFYVTGAIVGAMVASSFGGHASAVHTSRYPSACSAP